jgi:stearoyl-CoA desaturase (delta-9 desaturase)
MTVIAIREAPPVTTRVDVPFTLLNITSTIAAIILPFFFTSRSAVIAFLITYTIAGLGLTAGYHRLFAHRSYAVPKWLENAIAICGYMAIQRGPIFWVAMHRLHHAQVEKPGRDPHTPREGLWHVHFGWVQNRRSDVWNPKIYRRYAPDLVGDPLFEWMDLERHDYLAAFGLLGLSYLVGGVISPGVAGFDTHNAMCFLVWVGLMNRVALLQAFGLINSVCHLLGTRPFNTSGEDDSRNNLFVSLVIFGEGWHNNHHAFPTSARQGLRWSQLDIAWYTIWLLEKAGLARNVRLPSREAMARRARFGPPAGPIAAPASPAGTSGSRR